jgi:hypothetical protein
VVVLEILSGLMEHRELGGAVRYSKRAEVRGCAGGDAGAGPGRAAYQPDEAADRVPPQLRALARLDAPDDDGDQLRPHGRHLCRGLDPRPHL